MEAGEEDGDEKKEACLQGRLEVKPIYWQYSSRSIVAGIGRIS
eukprot:CAMPEP_0205916724 /NCGR_PEP_ID=MMETSP1325-20131115/8695_1 /ASSEMBLY_ACC=CAM_ASM_000708 /TAXON_ID=236786 /ORGANISM="Florenciella sp., Strain RCC1007" /LENGTH=42 /DNA_ID= /DNA_START= /DNA_END= /DNA_ORIENTATION=